MQCPGIDGFPYNVHTGSRHVALLLGSCPVCGSPAVVVDEVCNCGALLRSRYHVGCINENCKDYYKRFINELSEPLRQALDSFMTND